MPHYGMRFLLILGVILLPGCTPESGGAFVAANAASVVVFQRAIPDLVVSGVTGKDCSVVRLEQGKGYCKPQEAEPAPPPFCTRSLGVVDCWADPAALFDHPHEVADGPRSLTPAQEADRTKRWPGF
jgi:hypothetical protein